MHQHKKGYLKKILLDYKDVCNQVWNKKCLEGMSTNELNEIIIMSNQCARLRKGFTEDCCRGRSDRGHLGAIQRMEKIAKRRRRTGGKIVNVAILF